MRSLSRRDFLQGAVAVGGAAATVGLGSTLSTPLPARAKPPDFQPFREPGRIVKVTDERVLTKLAALPRPEPVRAMVDRAMCTLTGKATPAHAWASLVHADDVVGIKPNCLGGRFMATNKEVVDAVVAGLLSAGVRPGNIVVWEQQRKILERGRFRAASDDGRVRYVAIMHSYPEGDFGPEQKHGSGTSRYAELVQRVSAIVNLPVFKDHSIAGITVSMKNLTHGTIDNPFDYHHRNTPEIAHIYAHPLLAPKVRLTLADALRVEYDGGPRDSASKVLHHSVYASTDPVAMDATALGIIEALRKQKGLRTLEKAGRAATHVGAAQDLGLGHAEASRIRLERITL